jgi:hypothetical protein
MSGRHPESVKAMAGGHALGFHRRMSESSAIYEPMLPIGWVGERPADHELAWQDGTPVPAAWREVVVQRQLGCRVVVAMERRGLTILDCSKWPPGLANHGLPRIFRVDQLSEAAKPALIARLRLANSLLTLLHAASMAKSNESPLVARVHDRDLYRFDYPDESDEGYWYHPLGGGLPEVVTAADHHRIGVIPVSTVDLALDWLDMVVSADALVRFDLLNQTQAALVTHDYGLAVVAGWTVCELQVRARARTAGLQLSRRTPVAKVCSELEERNLLPKELGPRLATLRQRRNDWLHTGVEPDEATALEAVGLATAMLRTVIPDLTTRARRRWLVL